MRQRDEGEREREREREREVKQNITMSSTAGWGGA